MVEILKQTRSICSECGEIIPATYEVRDNEQVFFSRACPIHGVVDTDLDYQADFYRQSLQGEKLMIERYSDDSTTDISIEIASFH